MLAQILWRLIIAFIGTGITLAILGAMSIAVAWWIVLLIWLALVFLGELVVEAFD